MFAALLDWNNIHIYIVAVLLHLFALCPKTCRPKTDTESAST